MKQLFLRLAARLTRARRSRSPVRQALDARPQLEALEDRVVPAPAFLTVRPLPATAALNSPSPLTNGLRTAAATPSDSHADRVALTGVGQVNGPPVKITPGTLDLIPPSKGEKGAGAGSPVFHLMGGDGPQPAK